jgi:hypothetical protein
MKKGDKVYYVKLLGPSRGFALIKLVDDPYIEGHGVGEVVEAKVLDVFFKQSIPISVGDKIVFSIQYIFSEKQINKFSSLDKRMLVHSLFVRF